MGHGELEPLPCHFNLQRDGAEMPFLASDLEACPAPLLVMARDGDRGKRAWSESSSYDGRPLPSCERGQILALIKLHRQPGGASFHAADCLGLLLVMTLIMV
jgi:hypothetical protein